ncbi:MAG: hypothetical protein OQK82_05090 [Candidatus Pacearchaeota archaeon]|nr:hypothetical protein [Candidatus Pacearchaeota archaeon]
MKVESPLSGKPKTNEFKDSSGKTIRLLVKPRALTPFRAVIAEFFARLSALAIILYGGYYYVYRSYPYYKDMLIEAGVTLLTAWVAHKLLKYTFCWLLKKGTKIEFTPDHIRIKGLFRWKAYDMRLPHKFLILQHDKTPNDYEVQEIKSRQTLFSKNIDIRLYYPKSCHVVMDYANTRVDIMTVYEQKPASTIQARLTLCDEMMKNQLSGNTGIATSPNSQWDQGDTGAIE